MAVLEQRQAAEEQRKVADIRAALAPPRSAYQRLQPLDTGQHRRRMEGAGAHSPGSTAANNNNNSGSGNHDNSMYGGSGSSSFLALSSPGGRPNMKGYSSGSPGQPSASQAHQQQQGYDDDDSLQQQQQQYSDGRSGRGGGGLAAFPSLAGLGSSLPTTTSASAAQSRGTPGRSTGSAGAPAPSSPAVGGAGSSVLQGSARGLIAGARSPGGARQLVLKRGTGECSQGQSQQVGRDSRGSNSSGYGNNGAQAGPNTPYGMGAAAGVAGKVGRSR